MYGGRPLAAPAVSGFALPPGARLFTPRSSRHRQEIGVSCRRVACCAVPIVGFLSGDLMRFGPIIMIALRGSRGLRHGALSCFAIALFLALTPRAAANINLELR